MTLSSRPPVPPLSPRRHNVGSSSVVRIFANEAAVTQLIGALVLEQNDEWAVQFARFMSLETIAPLSADLADRLPPLAA